VVVAVESGDFMSTNAPKPVFSLTAILLLLAGCDSTYPPKLNGVYSLESAQSTGWTSGATLTPPTVTGVMRLTQWSVGPEWTHGYVRLEMTHASASDNQTIS